MPEYIYYAHNKHVHFSIQTFTSHQGGDSPSLATSLLEILMSHANWGKLSAAAGLNFTNIQLGGSCISRLDSIAFLLV